jgi:hypothetical protein
MARIAIFFCFLFSAGGMVVAQDSGDRFADTLNELQTRMQQLEEQNARLTEQLETLKSPAESADEKTVPIDEPLPESSMLEQLIQSSQQSDDRLSSLEERLKQDDEAEKKKKAEDAKKEKKWFEKYTIRGYTQIRINEVFRDDGPARPQAVGDSSIGDNQSFLIRRARLVFQGDVSDHLSVYIQPDFATAVPGSPDSNQFAQIRDFYADVYLDDQKELRFRIGQSKIPYGWENLQSSGQRLPLDRNDAMNSTFKNERDLGVMFYWTPVEVQEIFDYMNKEGFKWSGNYGMFGAGICNGQGGSLREQNDNLHAVARFTMPFWLNQCQLVEMGIQGYTGQYTVLSSAISPLGVGPAVRPTGTLETGEVDGIDDKRLACSFIYYPQPFGFQSEWNIGRGPALNDAQTHVDQSALYGGYFMAMYRQVLEKGELLPFARWNYFQGGYRTERNAPYCEIQEWEFGTEWQFSKSLELVSMYTITDRTNTTAISSANTRSYEQFNGQMVRFQVQFNY